MDEELVKGGQGRCSAELQWNVRVWYVCVLVCIAFVVASLLTGCTARTEDAAGRSLRKTFNGM
jgi:hypothetical protein